MSTLTQRYTLVQEQIAQAAAKAGRSPDEITLIAVSKKQPHTLISDLAALGHTHFGENFMQEALSKIEELPSELNFHFIGHLQSNKARFVPDHFHLVHTVDSIKLANALNKAASKNSVVQQVLVQVNIGRETQKSGVDPDDVSQLVESMLELQYINLQGFMTMPPFSEQGEKARPFFSELRRVRDKLEQTFSKNFPELSMGMSGDYHHAILEGSTMVRIGTDIFGKRPG